MVTTRAARREPLSPRPYLIFFLMLGMLFSFAYMLRLPVEEPEFPLSEPISLPQTTPDFSAMTDVNERKDAFFAYLLPFIEVLNREILTQRGQLERLLDKVRDGINLTRRERSFIADLSRTYRVQPQLQYSENHLRTLLRRVDIIPASLVLAQAANESAWGTSRFAVEGNNYFGQWCFSEGCGLVPNRRGTEASHEVRSFDSVQESVIAYFMNINTFESYLELRMIRQRLREQGRAVDGISLAEGLQSYSERGEAYIDELQAMIQFNALDEMGSADI